ncbi:ATP-binding protein [Streptomyces sp. NPDC059544]|uniref:ATP-binding protein n=1 Tax=Streptomyces sp. NPDC059544 TaxID=3346861 RepID=UPI0036C6931A
MHHTHLIRPAATAATRTVPAASLGFAPDRELTVAGPWRLPRTPGACGQARSAVCSTLADWGLDQLADTAELLVSELVGNALLHAYGSLSLTVVRREVMCFQVRDGSRKLPQLRPAQTTDEFGRGLRLVDLMASKWGADPTPWGKEVWFELPEAPDPLGGGWG